MIYEDKLNATDWGRLHWSSSPDRGLDNVLYLLPFIKEKCPEVHLHIFYGFYNWEAAAKSRNDEAALTKIEELKSLIKQNSDSVTLHGRISQTELAQEWKKAWCWFYPTEFQETNCITAQEAQLSFTPIVCSNVAALETTVGKYGYMLPNPYSKDSRVAYVEELTKLYHDKVYWSYRSKHSGYGQIDRDYSWETISTVWETYIP